MIRHSTIAILLISLSSTYAIDNRKLIGHSSRFLSEASPIFSNHRGVGVEGTRWAVLIGGSYGWENYRHQADVCHAYQLLKKGGLKDENIITMMYDDIADNPENPRPGVIINTPNGSDVYKGVPKDYTGEDVNKENFFNVLLGNESAIKGGNGKVVNSGPKDHIFIFYVDHGGPLIIGMPNDYITAKDLNKVLKKKHAMGTYKSMVFYLEACEAGSMFDGLLPKNISIYATTASSPYENSFGYYCPGEENPPPKEFDTCLGDLYSISWMEDWERNSTAAETLKQQFKKVKKRTANYSHVLEYGDLSLSDEKVSVYLGENPEKDAYVNELSSSQFSSSVHQRDAKLLYLREKFRRAPEGSERKLEAKKQIIEAMKHREYVDNSIKIITKLLFGSEKGIEVMKSVRPAGQPPVDDWDCFESLLYTYEAKCGALSPYGRKHTRIFANFCNAGIRQEQMEKAATQVCASKIQS